MLPLQQLPVDISDPRIYAGVLVAVLLILQYQRTLTWPEYRQIHRAKLKAFPVLDTVVRAFLISHKLGPEDDDEYLTTTDKSIKQTWKQLVRSGGSPHLLNSIKQLPDGSLSQAHVVWLHSDGSQTEAYLFDAGELGTHVYAHNEVAVTQPEDHVLHSNQHDGDPKGVVQAALGIDPETGKP